jgi:hypothetical protein
MAKSNQRRVRTLDVVAKNLAVALSSALSESLERRAVRIGTMVMRKTSYLATFTTARHVIGRVLGRIEVLRRSLAGRRRRWWWFGRKRRCHTHGHRDSTKGASLAHDVVC